MGSRTADYMFISRHLIDLHVKQRKKYIFAAFIDFEKAFDTIWRDALLYKLLKTGVHGRMFKIIRFMYSDTYYGVKCSDGHTPFFSSVTGVRQGCNLSPILFNLFLNDITKIFSDINGSEIGSKKINYLLYADDLQLLCKCCSDLQLCLSRLHKYTIKCSLKINIKKSKLIVFSKYRRRNQKRYINGEQLQQVDKYTYLGIVFYRTGCLRQAPLSLSNKASEASMSLLQALCKKNIPIKILLKVFDTTVGPILTYGSDVWGSFSFQS